ncbi:MAG: hypothetical protein E7507_03385 [Ruminococcus sp.]|nr:hypothetical protein [Ruminococcus sp.]
MGKIIKLENKVVINGDLDFIMSKAAYKQMGSQSVMNNIASFLSSNNGLLISVREDKLNSCLIKVYLPNGIINCRINLDKDKGALMITSFTENTMDNTNIALSRGVVFYFNRVTVKVTLEEIRRLYENGSFSTHDVDRGFNQSGVIGIRKILDYFHENNISEDNDIKHEKKEPDEELKRMLDTAEHYSLLAYDLESKKIIESGKTAYFGIESVEYDRNDRTAYRFNVFEMDEKLFKAKVQVAVESRTGKIYSAEITSVIKEDDESPAVAVILLFEKQVSINEFESSGFISLSSSTVNRDVQCEAIKKLRSGEANAKYMDDVIGKNNPSGFENKDLSEVINKLQAKKYPPNASQMEAIKKGINSKDVFLVMGPPGTGKTTVILEWIKYFVFVENKRVLVSSQNNKAVDNVLARIAEEKGIDVIRIGSESKMQSDVIPYMFENKLANLRNSIDESTSDGIETLNSLIIRWGNYKNRFDDIYDLYCEYKERRKNFEVIVQKNLARVYHDIKGIVREIEEYREDLRELKEQIEIIFAKIKEYESSDTFIKVIKFLPNCFRKLSIKRKAELHSLLSKEYRRKNEKYEAKKQEFNDWCDKIFIGSYSALYELYHKCYYSSADVALMPSVIENKWKYFYDLHNIAIESVDDYEKVKSELDSNMKKAVELKNLLEKWHDNIINTQNYALNSLILENVNLVGATCIGINSQKRFASLEFDVTIIDEAGQIQIHNALVPMSVSNKLIMLGDHKQIPPQADSELMDLCDENEIETELLEKSLFEKMYEMLPESNKTMLDTQYRMPGEIADVISDWFYDGKYYSHESKRNLKSPVPSLSSKPFLIIDTSVDKTRFETKIEGGGCRNNLEADVIRKTVEFIVDTTDYDIKEIGIISAYSSQVALIKKKLKKKIGENEVKEMVATLDSFQGQERDIIIYSFTKSSKVSPRYKRIGFLKELRRLNVAMSRCKKMLILVGDMKFLRECMNQSGPNGENQYEKSEKQFSDFVTKVCEAADKGYGEFIQVDSFLKKLGGE